MKNLTRYVAHARPTHYVARKASKASCRLTNQQVELTADIMVVTFAKRWGRKEKSKAKTNRTGKKPVGSKVE